ncbi:MAG: T9SS type A sorting domain-containing protein [Saprospiraceae bacterium]|nr:T9SS type A sorting domain-containing protein [Saprospiraceae bacterium]
MDGHKMLSCLYNGEEKIDISQIPPGVYLLRVFDNNRRMTAIRWVKN